MEPGPRRRRTSPPLVAAFLRDPGSGRVYRRGELIGKGASSRCYLLTDMCSGAVFALKVVPRGGSLRGKVEREVALHSCLRHRNVVALHGHFADRDHVYLVLEYCSRQSLAHVLKARQRLTEPEVRYYLRGLVSGLRYLHQRRIVHRDLKPSNFFLNDSMEVKIGDLGLATRVGPGGRCHRVLCGTPNFLAPEVISRNGHSCQSDIWALGCTMYTALTGAPPFTGAPLEELFQNIRAGRYAEPAHLSPGARRLLARLLAPEPAARPSLDLLLQDDFFTQGFTPERLPAHSCRRPPGLALPQPLCVILRQVGRLVLSPRRAPGPSTEAPGPEAGLETESAAWASESGGLRTPSPPPTRSPEGASGGSRQNKAWKEGAGPWRQRGPARKAARVGSRLAPIRDSAQGAGPAGGPRHPAGIRQPPARAPARTTTAQAAERTATQPWPHPGPGRRPGPLNQGTSALPVPRTPLPVGGRPRALPKSTLRRGVFNKCITPAPARAHESGGGAAA